MTHTHSQKKKEKTIERIQSVSDIQNKSIRMCCGCYDARVFNARDVRWELTMVADPESEQQSYTHRSIICFPFIPPGKLGKQFKTVNHSASYLVGGGSTTTQFRLYEMYGEREKKKTLNRDIHLDILINKNSINAPGLGVCTYMHATHTHTHAHSSHADRTNCEIVINLLSAIFIWVRLGGDFIYVFEARKKIQSKIEKTKSNSCRFFIAEPFEMCSVFFFFLLVLSLCSSDFVDTL